MGLLNFPDRLGLEEGLSSWSSLLLEQMMFLETKVKLSFRKKINYVNYTFILQKIIYWISVCFSFNSVDLRNYFHYTNVHYVIFEYIKILLVTILR